MMQRLLDKQKDEINGNIRAFQVEVSGRLTQIESAVCSNEDAIEVERKTRESQIAELRKEIADAVDTFKNIKSSSPANVSSPQMPEAPKSDSMTCVMGGFYPTQREI
eukprot:10865336-Karenia_brevis.AAC.1